MIPHIRILPFLPIPSPYHQYLFLWFVNGVFVWKANALCAFIWTGGHAPFPNEQYPLFVNSSSHQRHKRERGRLVQDMCVCLDELDTCKHCKNASCLVLHTHSHSNFKRVMTCFWRPCFQRQCWQNSTGVSWIHTFWETGLWNIFSFSFAAPCWGTVRQYRLIFSMEYKSLASISLEQPQ